MSCDIIIPVWNQLELTKDCIGHIVKNTDYPYRLIIIDNGSDKETQEYLSGLSRNNNPPVLLIRNQANLGFVKAVNQGLKQSDAEYVCLLNNDVLAGEGWLTEMINVANREAGAGIVNPDSSEEADADLADNLLGYRAHSRRIYQGDSIEIMGAMGFCMLIKREVINRVGILDEAFGLGGYDDMDYSRRAWKAGYKCVKAKGAYVIHRVHSSFDSLGNKRKRKIGRQTRALFWQRWGKIPRVAFIISKATNDKEFINRIFIRVHDLAREWNMVELFLRESANSFQPEHQSINLKKYPDRFFLLRCLGNILKPKKKRLKFKTVFVDNPRFAKFLRLLSLIHGAKVVIV